MTNDISQSGPIASKNYGFSESFTDLEIIFTGSFNIIVRATRYGLDTQSTYEACEAARKELPSTPLMAQKV